MRQKSTSLEITVILDWFSLNKIHLKMRQQFFNVHEYA